MKSQQKTTDVMLENDDIESVDVLEMLYYFLAHWKVIVCAGLVGAIAAVVITICFITPLYSAKTQIYVLGRRDSVINMADLQIGAALTNDYVEFFNIWEVHEAVISNLGLDYTYSQLDKMVKVTNVSNSRVLKITVTSSSAEEAANLANEYAKVASEYISETMSTDKPSLMSTALVPTNPISPNKAKNTVIGFLLGIIISIGVYFVMFLLDDKLKTSDDIKKYSGLVTLSIVPLQGVEESKNQKNKKQNQNSTGGENRT